MAEALAAMGFTRDQADEMLALCDGDFDAALHCLLETASAEEGGGHADARTAEAAPRRGPPLADDKLELLMGVAGCGVLRAAKALARARGDVEKASRQLLDGGSGGGANDPECLLSHKELAWSLQGSWATRGLHAQLEAICGAEAQRLQVYMRATVSAALLGFLRERQPGAEWDPEWRVTAAWAARVLNAVADGSHLLQLPTVELLLDCCLADGGGGGGGGGGGDSTPQALSVANASGSLNDVLCSMLRRIDLESQGEPELRQASCAPVLAGMLRLISSFVAANPRSPLPAACQTAMELARGLAQDEAVVRNVWPTDELVQALSTVLRHHDDDCQAQVGGLDILHGLVGAYSQAGGESGAGVSPELLALLTSADGAVLSVLLTIVAQPPGPNVGGDAGAGVCVVYTEACALVAELISASVVISDLLCAASYGEANYRAAGRGLTVSGGLQVAEVCLLDFYKSGLEPQLAHLYYGVLTEPEPEPEPEPEARGLGVLQALLSAFDADVGCSAVCDATVALLSTIAHVRFSNHATAQRKLHECAGAEASSSSTSAAAGGSGGGGSRGSASGTPRIELLAMNENEHVHTPVEAMEEVLMQDRCVRDVFLRCAHSWSMQTRLQTPRAAMSFSAADALGWDKVPEAAVGECEVARGWDTFTVELLPALLEAHYRHAKTCSFLSVLHSCLRGPALTAAVVTTIAPRLAKVVRELLSQDAPRMTTMALHLINALLSCPDESAAAVAALALARQGISETTGEGMEHDADGEVQRCIQQCQRAFERVLVLPHAETGLALDRIAQQLLQGEVEALSELARQLSSLHGVTQFEAERVGLFSSLVQLVSRAGVGVLLDRLDGVSLRLLVELLQASIACIPLPIYRLPVNMRGSSTGDGLACLFQPLAVRFWRANPRSLLNSNAKGDGDEEKEKGSSSGQLHISGLFEPIVGVAELENYILRKTEIRHPTFLAYCRDLVGCWIEDSVDDREGNTTKRVAYVVNFDEDKCEHTLLYETNVSPPLVRSKFARGQHLVLMGRRSEHHVVAQAKQAEIAAQEASASGWKALFGSSTTKSLVGVKVAARSVMTTAAAAGSQDAAAAQVRRWRPATVVAGQTTGRNAVSLVYDDDPEGHVHRVEIVDSESNQCVFSLVPSAATAVADQSDQGGGSCTWQFLSEDGWENYSAEDSYKLESSRQNGSHGCALLRRDGQQLIIDFKAMVQRDYEATEAETEAGGAGGEGSAEPAVRPIRRAASSINLWSAIERPRASSDEARRRALSESEALSDDEPTTAGDAANKGKRPTPPVLAVTLHDLRGYLESGSPRASNGRTGSMRMEEEQEEGGGVADGGDSAEKSASGNSSIGVAQKNGEGHSKADDDSPINSKMTLFQCIMHSAAGRNFSWDQTWSVDYRITVDGEDDGLSHAVAAVIEEEEEQEHQKLPEAVPDVPAAGSASISTRSNVAGVDAYTVSGSALQQINGCYYRSSTNSPITAHDHPVYVGTGDSLGKMLYWQPKHAGEWVISDAVGSGYRAVNRIDRACAFEDNAPRKCWHVWRGTTREWVEELAVTVEPLQALPTNAEATGASSPAAEPESEVEPEPESSDADAEQDEKSQLGSHLVVVVMENQRCTPSVDSGGGTFSSDALLPSERGQWTDSDGHPLPSPHSNPDPPEGWAWLPQTPAASHDETCTADAATATAAGWSTPTGWLYSAEQHTSHWLDDHVVTTGDKAGALVFKPSVRRRRWERSIVRLPPPPTTPRTPAKPILGEARQSWGSPTELVRIMMSEASPEFKRQWGLLLREGSASSSFVGGVGTDADDVAESIAAQMGEQFVMQAFRDFQGAAFEIATQQQQARQTTAMVAVGASRSSINGEQMHKSIGQSASSALGASLATGLPSYTEALALPAAAVPPPPPSYAAIMGGSSLGLVASSESSSSFDEDLFSAVMRGSPASTSRKKPLEPQPQPQPEPEPPQIEPVPELELEPEPEPLHLVLELASREKDEPFAPSPLQTGSRQQVEMVAEDPPVRSPCASLIYGAAGSYRQFDSRDITTRCSGTDSSQRSSPPSSSTGRPELRLLTLLHSAQSDIRGNDSSGGSGEGGAAAAAAAFTAAAVHSALLGLEWSNRCLIFKLRQQLADPLAVVSSAFPSWIEELMSSCPFLFPIALREEFFRVSAFGAARAVEWLRVQRKQQRNANANAPLGDRLGPLRVERWLIRRNDFLNQARQLLAHHAARRSLLLVEFEGESGIGTGVHVSFFTDAAARLSETAENEGVLGMWMPDATMPPSESLQCTLHPASLLGIEAAGAGASQVKSVSDGSQVRGVLRRFELLGWLFGKALIDKRHDERLLPLRLSPVFLDLALGRDPLSQSSSSAAARHGQWATLATVASGDVQGGAMVLLLLSQLAGVRDGSTTEQDAAEMIEMCDITFVDPAVATTTVSSDDVGAGTADEVGVPLCPGGAERVLVWDDVEEFLGLLSAAWLGEGVRLQCDYFARALGQVVPLQKLQLFTTTELLELVCGAAVQWNGEDLEACVVPGDGYTRDSPPYRWLLEVLEALTDDSGAGSGGGGGSGGAAQRAAFLQFVTARPRLPAGGLRALPCPIRVQLAGGGGSTMQTAEQEQEQAAQAIVDGRLPTAHTCSLTLDLPVYSSKAVLSERLAAALRLMAEYEGLVD